MVAKTIRELINFWDGWQCGACGEEFQSQGELISHQYQYHGGMRSKQIEFSQKCFSGTASRVEPAERSSRARASWYLIGTNTTEGCGQKKQNSIFSKLLIWDLWAHVSKMSKFVPLKTVLKLVLLLFFNNKKVSKLDKWILFYSV